MVKSKKQKPLAWIKMPMHLMDDDRVAELIAQKGMAGLGTYLAIIREMYSRQCRCLTENQVKTLRFSGAKQKTVKTVLDEFGLFHKDKMGHIYSVIDFLGLEDDDEIDDATTERVRSVDAPSFPTPARVINKDIDKDKEHHLDGADCIRQIPEDSQWTDIALMKSGFGMLIKRNWHMTLQLFHDHTVANCTIEQISNVEDAKKYFYFYVTNAVSGNMLRKALEDHERQHPQQNPYRFEDVDRISGHRFYHGMPIPDDAPPRPDDRADWDYEKGCWISSQW